MSNHLAVLEWCLELQRPPSFYRFKCSIHIPNTSRNSLSMRLCRKLLMADCTSEIEFRYDCAYRDRGTRGHSKSNSGILTAAEVPIVGDLHCQATKPSLCKTTYVVKGSSGSCSDEAPLSFSATLSRSICWNTCFICTCCLKLNFGFSNHQNGYSCRASVRRRDFRRAGMAVFSSCQI